MFSPGEEVVAVSTTSHEPYVGLIVKDQLYIVQETDSGKWEEKFCGCDSELGVRVFGVTYTAKVWHCSCAFRKPRTIDEEIVIRCEEIA